LWIHCPHESIATRVNSPSSSRGHMSDKSTVENKTVDISGVPQNSAPTIITPLRRAEADLKKERAAVRSLQAQTAELRETINQLQTSPYTLFDIRQQSREYLRYKHSNNQNVRFHRTTPLARATTLTGFTSDRDRHMLKFESLRTDIVTLSQKIAILDAQVEADTQAGIARMAADELKDALDQERELWEEKNNVRERIAAVRTGKKRARSLQLREDLEEDVVSNAVPELEITGPEITGPEITVPALETVEEVKSSEPFVGLTDEELIGIANLRGYHLLDNTPRSAIITILNASNVQPVSPVSQISQQLAGSSIVPPVDEVLSGMNDYLM